MLSFDGRAPGITRRRPLRTRALASLVGLAGALVVARAAGPAVRDIAEGCRAPIAARDLRAIAADPPLLLRGFPDGGASLVWRIRVVATAGAAGLGALARVIPLANEAQKLAIGEGLARAAAACDAREGAVTTRIADMVRAAGDTSVRRALTAYLTNTANAPALEPPGPRSDPIPALRLDGAVGDAERTFDDRISRGLGPREP